MPGDFIEEVRIYRCGTHTDGTAIFCSEIGWAKVLFEKTLSEDAPNVGWQHADDDDIHVPLSWLADALRPYGVTVAYDEEELSRRLGPPSEPTGY